MTEVDIRTEPLDGPEGRELLTELDADLAARYGDDEEVDVVAEEFLPPDGCFLVARVDGLPQACGGYRRIDATTAEVKRMYVRPAARGIGLARRLLAELEAAAAAAGYRRLWLETGLSQPEAMQLYQSAGYSPIPPFGQFSWAPGQRCYGKTLDSRSTAPPGG